MWRIFQWLLIYVIGGVTFVPLVVVLIIYYVLTYGSTPIGDSDPEKLRKSFLQHTYDDSERSSRERAHSSAAIVSGWLTVRRQFNNSSKDSGALALGQKPSTDLSGAETSEDDKKKEEPTPAGDIAPPLKYSSRLAQTYRQMIDVRVRAKRDSPPKEYFFSVLKGNVLFLYENEDQTNCVAAIGIDKYIVGIEKPDNPDDVYRGRDGEMFAKRNAIRLQLSEPRISLEEGEKTGLPVLVKGMSDGVEKDERDTEYAPWFLFSKSNTKMEDWYLALVQASAKKPKYTGVFSVSDMQALVNKLDSEPDPIPMRWLNGMLGRVFLGITQTAALEDIITGKIMKKLSKVQVSSLLSPIVVREVNIGRVPPFFSKPMLKELTADGSASFEVNMHCQHPSDTPDSGIRITISTSATFPTGFKPVVVDLDLAVVIRNIEGNILLKIKAPPSNRIWWGFTQQPKMDIEIIPVVSDRVIQLGVVLKTIENQLREVIADSVVLPNMDDIAWFDTTNLEIRGGIFDEAKKQEPNKSPRVRPSSSQSISAGTEIKTSAEDPSSATVRTPTFHKSRPVKSQTVDLNGSHDITVSDDDIPGTGLMRTDTAPALLATGPSIKKVEAVQATRKWFSQTGRPPSLFSQRNESAESVSHDIEGTIMGHSTSEPNLGRVALTTSSKTVGDDLAGTDNEQLLDGCHMNNQADVLTLTRAIDESHDNASTAALLSAVKARDKKALQSQVNVARDAVKKWGINWASKRKNVKFDGEVPDEQDAGHERTTMQETPETTSPSRSPRSTAGRSLQERLNAVAHTASVSTSPQNEKTIRRSSSSSVSAGANVFQAPSLTSPDAPGQLRQYKRDSFRDSETNRVSFDATEAPLLESHPVQLQPVAARSMVVPRVPKRPGTITGIGHDPRDLNIGRDVSSTEDAPGRPLPPIKSAIPAFANAKPPPLPARRKPTGETKDSSASVTQGQVLDASEGQLDSEKDVATVSSIEDSDGPTDDDPSRPSSRLKQSVQVIPQTIVEDTVNYRHESDATISPAGSDTISGQGSPNNPLPPKMAEPINGSPT